MSRPLFISHGTALECLRATASSGRVVQRVAWVDVPARPPAVAEVRRAVAVVPILRATPVPTHLLVFGRSAAHAYADYVSHGLSVDLPKETFWKVAPNVMAAGPELALIQYAAGAQGPNLWRALGLRSPGASASPQRSVGFEARAGQARPARRRSPANVPDAVDVLMLCYELCGSYALCSSGALAARKDPLTTTADLERFCAALSHVPGVRLVRAVLPFARDNARSPMEARLVLVLCLPMRLGGYGLPWPRLNVSLDARPVATGPHDPDSITPDLYWDYANYAIEYDSRAEHERKAARDGDSIRRGTLQLLGVDVDTVRTAQLLDLPHMDNVARLVARRLGVRLRHQFDSDVVRKRVALRRRLFRGMHLTWGDALT